MKNKIILTFLIILSFWFNYVNADTENESNWVTIIKVTEKVPWANCTEMEWSRNNDWSIKRDVNGNVVPIIWQCEVWQWSAQIISMLWEIIKYFTYIASLFWVLFIVYNWILYSMWWADQSLKEESKKRIIATLIWLLVLFLSGPILQIIAPWIYV